MPIYKTKSLDKSRTDKEVEQIGCVGVRFISFERAIQETNKLNGITEKPIGYRITEHGIDVLY